MFQHFIKRTISHIWDLLLSSVSSLMLKACAATGTPAFAVDQQASFQTRDSRGMRAFDGVFHTYSIYDIQRCSYVSFFYFSISLSEA